MKWLLITNDADLTQSLDSKLLEADKKNKLISIPFDTNEIVANKKIFRDLAACIIYSNDSGNLSSEIISLLSSIQGYFAYDKITLISNLSFIYNNKLEIFNEFLEAGMEVNVRDDFGTPMLNIACRNDNFEFVEMLLNLGAELNAVSEDRGYTAVMDAIWRGNEKITKYLISKGADLNTINKEGQTNLILAVGADRFNLVQLLVENGADPDIKDGMGMSAYNYATLFRKEKIAEILKPYHKE